MKRQLGILTDLAAELTCRDALVDLCLNFAQLLLVLDHHLLEESDLTEWRFLLSILKMINHNLKTTYLSCLTVRLVGVNVVTIWATTACLARAHPYYF